jgi:hypothetical protein
MTFVSDAQNFEDVMLWPCICLSVLTSIILRGSGFLVQTFTFWNPLMSCHVLPEPGFYMYSFEIQLNVAPGGLCLINPGKSPKMLAWWDELIRFAITPGTGRNFTGVFYRRSRIANTVPVPG